MVQYRKDRISPWMVQIRDSRGQLITRSFVKREDAEEFEAAEKRKRKLLKAGLEAPREEILFIDYAKRFLSQRFQGGKASTVRQDESRLRNYWLEKFGVRPLQGMTGSEIKEHLDHIQFELKHSPADRNRHRALMHKLFQDALMDNKVVFNPVSRVPLVDESKKRHSSGVLETADEEIYISALYAEGSQYGMLGDLMIWTGARIMSAAAIQYRDVHFDLSVVRLCRIIERATRVPQERTKGGGEGGEEIVPLFPRLKDSILSHRAISPYIRPTDFIASAPDGTPLSYESFRGAHKRVLAKTGLQRFTPHALRKRFATNAKRAGYTRSEIREMLGHSSDLVTARYDLKDIEHLVEKGRRLGFGASVSALSAKKLVHLGQGEGNGS